MSDEKIIVGISQGDINGIGLEVIIKTFLDPQMLEICTPVVFGSLKTASFHRKALNIEDFSFNQINDISEINQQEHPYQSQIGNRRLRQHVYDDENNGPGFTYEVSRAVE